MKNIHWDDFKKIEMRVGTIIEVNDFPEAIKRAYQLKINLGKKIGVKQWKNGKKKILIFQIFIRLTK